MHRLVRFGLISGALGALGIQLIPYGRDHDSPPGAADAPWPSAEVRDLAVGACYDCHSFETEWPWYSNVAPMSWLVQRDVDRGRAEWNLSIGDDDFGDAAATVEDGEMPPEQYTWLHPDARLSAEERARLVAALEQMDDDDGGGGRGRNRGRGGGDDD